MFWTMPRPRNNKIGVSFLLPRAMKEQLDKLAAFTRRTRSAYVEIALEEQFKKDEKDLKKAGVA
jgi:predicted transcriptional regulator